MSGLEGAFVQTWGRLAAAFGMGDATGQVHAVVFLAEEAQSVDLVAQASGLPRGVCATELEKLVEYGALLGDGQHGYSAQPDPWTFFSSVIRCRASREFVPLLSALRHLHEQAQKSHVDGELSKTRLHRISTFCRFVDQVSRLIETLGGGASSKPMLSAARIMARFMG